jgi:large subunit ribosomal protein L25
MENLLRVKAESRKEVGKKFARRLRREGKIPAIIYGEKKESIPITLLLNDVKNILKSEKGENTILRFQRDDIEVDAMLKETQYDYLSDNIIHADFIRIDLDKAVTVSVPVATKGEAIGVRVEDGIFDFMTREVKVKCLAANIPKEFEVDIDELHSGSSIKAEDLDIPEGIQLLSDPNTVICAVNAKGKAEEEVEVEVEAEEEEGAAVEKDAAETAEEKPKAEAGDANKEEKK